MPKDTLAQNFTLSQNLLSLIKKDKEIARLQKELDKEKARNKFLLEDNSGIKALTSTLQELLNIKDEKISTLQNNFSVLLEEQSQLKNSNQILISYITQPFWKRWTQRIRFFLLTPKK